MKTFRHSFKYAIIAIALLCYVRCNTVLSQDNSVIESECGKDGESLELRKKIMVIWCKGGGCHTSMLTALEQHLGSTYDVVAMNPFDHVWSLNDSAREAVGRLVPAALQAVNIAPIDGKAIYDLVANPTIANTLAMGIETIKWAKEDVVKNTGALYEYSNVIQNGLSYLSDYIKTISQKKSEDFYNFLVAQDKPQLANQFFKVSQTDMVANAKTIKNRFNDIFEREKPDLIISVIPVFNHMINEAALSLAIPFMLIAPDFDVSNYFFGQSPTPWGGFHCILPFNEAIILESAKKAELDDENIKFFGFPLRTDFFETHDVDALKKQMNIPDNKSVIMLMMGGAGSNKVLTYLNLLREFREQLHVIVLIGNNYELGKELTQNMFLPDNISLQIVSYTNRVSDYMAISDVLIAKAGPGTLCEALQVRLPIIIDATSELLEWEKSHAQFVTTYGLGTVIYPTSDFERELKKILSDTRYRKYLKNNMSRWNNNHFSTTLIPFVDSLINKNNNRQSN